MRSISLPAILFVFIFLTISIVTASAGTYKDTAGTTHSWSVNDSRALVWEGSAYVPFGVMFEPRSFSEQNDANLKADQDDIAAIKLAGLSDVLIRPGKAIASIPAETFQKVIDLLDSSDLHYGIELYNSPYSQITGYVIQPLVNRLEITASAQVTREFPGADSVLYVLCDARSGEVKSYNTAAVNGGQATIPITLPSNGNYVLLFYPVKTIVESSPDYSLPDIWNGYDTQRDRLLLYLKQLKLGKGLRFFIDPFSEKFGMRGEMQNLIPVSKAYRIEYSAWLSRKYGNPRDLTLAWGILKHDMTSFDEATRIIPLWNGGRGAASAFDDGTGKTYGVDVTRSSIWSDFQDFRTQSLSGYMDSMADVLKRTVADVPVVYTATDMQAIYQPKNTAGYDGLATPASPNGTLVSDEGKILSLAETSTKKPWLIAKLGPAGTSYEKKDQLFSAINNLHELGAKGYFASMAGKTVSSADLMLWLAEYASISAKDQRYADFRPQVIYYPNNFAAGTVRRLKSGVWWLPTLSSGAQMDLGASLTGYALVDPKLGTSDIYIWSPSGGQTINVVSETAITVLSDIGEATDIKPKKGRIQISVTPEPQIIRGIDPQIFLPVETVVDAIAEFEKAIKRADTRAVDTTQYKRNLKSAKNMVGKNQLGIAMDLARTSTLELNQRLKLSIDNPNSKIPAPTSTGN